MATSSESVSWFKSAFPSVRCDRLEQVTAARLEVPDCGICLETVSDPIALKCGHIFDRHCIKQCLASGLTKCPYDRKDVAEADFQEQHDIYARTKCRIRASVMSSTRFLLINTECSIFSTMEKVKEIVISQYLKGSGEDEVPKVETMTVRGSFYFYPGKTLADYEVLPGEETLMWVFLA